MIQLGEDSVRGSWGSLWVIEQGEVIQRVVKKSNVVIYGLLYGANKVLIVNTNRI